MAEPTQLYNNIAALKNVAALAMLTERLQSRDVNLPGMGTFYGPSGYGKTTAAAFVANEYNAYHVQVKSTWTRKKFCEEVLAEMGIARAKTIADMVDQISEELAKSGRPLLVDEADFLVSKTMIEIVRDIYESSFSPVILIGEERLPQKLQKWERVHGRMLDWVAAQPAELGDVAQLARIYCRDVEVAPDLQEFILRVSNHSIRRVSTNLSRVREFALTTGLTGVTRSDWGDQEMFTGTAPAPRRALS